MSPDPLLSSGVWHETNLNPHKYNTFPAKQEKCSMVSASKEYSIIYAYPQSQAEASSAKAQGLTLNDIRRDNHESVMSNQTHNTEETLLTKSEVGLYTPWTFVATTALLRKKRQADVLSPKWRNILPTSFRATAWS